MSHLPPTVNPLPHTCTLTQNIRHVLPNAHTSDFVEYSLFVIDSGACAHTREGVSGQVAEVLVRCYASEDFSEVRVAVVGNVDSGKSTLLGVLTRGQLDNGRGLARANVFTHKHELETGRTSSISHEIVGFDSKGKVVNYSGVRGMTESDIVSQSAKVVNFIDLAGHEKYLKTTVFGLTGHAPDYAMLMIGANMGVVGMTKEHLGIAMALRVPVFVVLTKIDMCPEHILKETMQQIKSVLKSPGCRKIPIVVRNEDDVLVCARNFSSERISPIFCVSNVTGENLELLRHFLNLLPARCDWEHLGGQPTEFHIDATWSVPGVGTVTSGTLMSGKITVNQNLLLGPDEFGKFSIVQVKSIHSKRLPVKQVRAGQTAAIALKKIARSSLRKGMVLLDTRLKPQACWEFEAEVLVLYHSTTISPNYQAVVNCGVAQQAARILSMDMDYLRTRDKAKVRFRFMYWPEYIKEGARLIFREGRTKGIGKVTKIFAPEEELGLEYVDKIKKRRDKSPEGEKEEESNGHDAAETNGNGKHAGTPAPTTSGAAAMSVPIPIGGAASASSSSSSSSSSSRKPAREPELDPTEKKEKDAPKDKDKERREGKEEKAEKDWKKEKKTSKS